MTSLLLGFSTLTLAFLSSRRSGSFPWEAVLLAVAVVSCDRAAAAFRAFGPARDSGRRAGYWLLAGIGLSAFCAVLVLFLALREGWPLLLIGAGALAAVLAFGSRAGVPHAPWGELLAALVPGTLLWLAAADVLDSRPPNLEVWWRSALLSVPSALFLASLATVRRSCEHGRAGHGVLLLPLGAYAAAGALAAVQLVPWTFYLILVAGPALSTPLWRAMLRRGFAPGTGALEAAIAAFLVFTLFSAGAWVTGNVLP